MSSRQEDKDKTGISSSSSSSSSSVSSSSSSSGRSRSSSSSSARSRSNSPETRRQNRREREYGREYEREHDYYAKPIRQRNPGERDSTSSNSRDRYPDQEENFGHKKNAANQQQQQQQNDGGYRYTSSKSTAATVTGDYDSIRSDKTSDSATSPGTRRTDRSSMKIGADDIDDSDDIPKAPAPPRISKTAILFGKPGTVAKPGIQMKLVPPKAKSETTKKITVASAFNNESDDETEEMPAECRMRMRNIGRDTPTSSGPNSFGKTKQGFVDTKKVFERSLREACAD